MNIPTSITKEVLWQYVNIKINRLFSTLHVFSVITILITEMIKELKDGKEIKIHNLGTLCLVKTKPRMHCDITKFRLTPRIKKKLRRELDLDKTYGAT
jgi:nucleoid DNA-binding protein